MCCELSLTKPLKCVLAMKAFLRGSGVKYVETTYYLYAYRQKYTLNAIGNIYIVTLKLSINFSLQE